MSGTKEKHSYANLKWLNDLDPRNLVPVVSESLPK